MILKKNYDLLFIFFLAFLCVGWLTTWEVGEISISKIFVLFIFISLIININYFKNISFDFITSYLIVLLVYNFFFYNCLY